MYDVQYEAFVGVDVVFFNFVVYNICVVIFHMMIL
jgi:hypothetical protein